MKTKILVLAVFLITGFFVQVSAQTEDGITTFVLVRHAEKADESQDPDLSPEGYARAADLDGLLENVRFDAVYSTPTIRTMETVRRIADRNSAEMKEYDHRAPDSMAKHWVDLHAGETVLISGHSNTTPSFANALLGREHFSGKFEESDYGNLLIVTIDLHGNRKLMHLRY